MFQVLRDLQIVAGENVGVRVRAHSAAGYSAYSNSVQILFLSKYMLLLCFVLFYFVSFYFIKACFDS